MNLINSFVSTLEQSDSHAQQLIQALTIASRLMLYIQTLLCQMRLAMQVNFLEANRGIPTSPCQIAKSPYHACQCQFMSMFKNERRRFNVISAAEPDSSIPDCRRAHSFLASNTHPFFMRSGI